jgi:hypothetical protein
MEAVLPTASHGDLALARSSCTTASERNPSRCSNPRLRALQALLSCRRATRRRLISRCFSLRGTSLPPPSPAPRTVPTFCAHAVLRPVPADPALPLCSMVDQSHAACRSRSSTPGQLHQRIEIGGGTNTSSAPHAHAQRTPCATCFQARRGRQKSR